MAIAGVGALGVTSLPSVGAALTYNLEPVEVAKDTWVLFGPNEGLSLKNGGFIANTVIIGVPAGVVVICSGPSRRFGKALLDLIGKLLPSRRVVRVFNTHHHPDHVFGNQVFDPSIIAATPETIEAFKVEGDGLSDNMYRVVGDWMRGTRIVLPSIALTQDKEVIGGRQFSYFYQQGHTAADLVIRDDFTGLLFTGDLTFHNRAPATPHADLVKWQESLAFVDGLKRQAIVPGHGPIDPDGNSIKQTSAYLKWLDETLRDAVSSGKTMNEAMELPIPAPHSELAFVRDEYIRSVVHLYRALEEELFAPVKVRR
jgi:uncharacterized sulfatase